MGWSPRRSLAECLILAPTEKMILPTGLARGDLTGSLCREKYISSEREQLTRTLLMMERRLLTKLLSHLLTEKWPRCHPRRSPSRAALETGSSPMTTGPG